MAGTTFTMANSTNALTVLLTLDIAVFMAGCSKQPTPQTTQSCAVLAADIASRERTFLSRLEGIREQHLSLREYDHQMIDALVTHSSELTKLTDAEEVSGCFGPRLHDVQAGVSEEKADISKYILMLRRAILSDPEGVYTH